MKRLGCVRPPVIENPLADGPIEEYPVSLEKIPVK